MTGTLPIQRLSLRQVALLLALALVAIGSFLVGRALATTADYYVNASGGYANTMSYANPSGEVTKGWHTAGLPYKARLYRGSDGAAWGPWTISTLDYYGIPGSIGGTITTQIDNLGTANPAAYNVSMF